MKLNEGPIELGISALMVFLSLVVSPAAGAKEGFGSSKDSVRMEWVVAPAVDLGATSFAVRTVEVGASWSGRLEDQLEKSWPLATEGWSPTGSSPRS